MSKKSKAKRSKYQYNISSKSQQTKSQVRASLEDNRTQSAGQLIINNMPQKVTNYKYIVPELIRIAIIAGIFFIILIILSLIIR